MRRDNVDCYDQECKTEYETSYEQQCSTSYVTECEAATPTYGSTSSGYGSPAAPKCSQKPQQSCQQVNILDRATGGPEPIFQAWPSILFR